MVNPRAIYKSGLPRRAMIVYVYLYDRKNAANQCWPSVRRIAKDLDISMRTVNRAIKDLKNAGYISTTHRIKKDGSWGSNLYELRF